MSLKIFRSNTPGFQFTLKMSSGANVIKLFATYYRAKLECLLDYAGKACKGQALQLITKISKLRTKIFYNIGPCLYWGIFLFVSAWFK